LPATAKKLAQHFESGFVLPGTSPGIEKQLAPLVLKGYLALKRQLHDNRLHYRYELLTA
jgi:hypothetical protein